MSIFVEVDYGSLNKINEELCGDKVEIIRTEEFMLIVLADGLGSGVKANILATLTSKIIGTMLSMGSSIDECVETIINTLPVCNERGIAYSTFSIVQIYNSGECYVVEFDNPSIIRLRKGTFVDLDPITREINGKLIKESRFSVTTDDVLVLVSDGAIHAGVGHILNLGWQWENIRDYLVRIYRKDISAKNISKLLLEVCYNLYAKKPGDDTTVITVKARSCLQVTVMIGPPLDSKKDKTIVNRLIRSEGKKVVCGGTTSQIVARELKKEVKTSFDYFDEGIPPTAEIEGIDLTTEGILTIDKALEYAKRYISPDSNITDFLDFNKQDGASKLAKLLIEESTSVSFMVGRAMNPAHQNLGFPYDLAIKLNFVEDMASCLRQLGKKVTVEYF